MKESFRLAALIAVAVAVPAPGGAQDASQGFAWVNATELSFVSTGGNASSTTAGLKGSLTGTGGANRFNLEVGGVRASSKLKTRTAVGTAQAFVVDESVLSETTAESYFARTRYDRSFGAGFAFGGAGWDRNTFAGVQNRFAFVVGVGRTFVEGDAGHFKADVGLTYTVQKDVDPVPGASDGFGGVRASFDTARKLSESATFTSMLQADENVQDTEDFRADWTNSVSVSINSSLALKTSLQLLFDNLPANIAVPLRSAGGVPTGTNVLTPNEKVDSVVTLTLVITL